MKSRTRQSLRAIAGATGILLIGIALGAEPPVVTSRSGVDKSVESSKLVDGEHRVTVEVARDRAKLMHTIYAATLDTVHHHYFRRERSVLPARAMEDIFTRVAEESKVQARWIAVNTKAMSIDHEPKSPFDKMAAEKIASGDEEYERIEGGYYQRAGAIPLGSGCLGCHAGFGASPTRLPRFAALVITVPLNVK